MLVDGVVDLQLVLICTVFARNLTKCWNKGKYGMQAALHSLMVGRCPGPGSGGTIPWEGEVNTEHGSIYIQQQDFHQETRRRSPRSPRLFHATEAAQENEDAVGLGRR